MSSTRRMSYTCSDVDQIFQELLEEIQPWVEEEYHPELDPVFDRHRDLLKDRVTHPFRAALDDCIDELKDAQSALSDKESECLSLESDYEAAQEEVQELKGEVADLRIPRNRRPACARQWPA